MTYAIFQFDSPQALRAAESILVTKDSPGKISTKVLDGLVSTGDKETLRLLKGLASDKSLGEQAKDNLRAASHSLDKRLNPAR